MARHFPTASILLAAAALFAAPAGAGGDDDDHDARRASARLSSFQEVPALSSGGAARFAARLEGGSISYEFSYRGLESDATQAHIHFGQMSVNGGIAVFLCSNLGNGPAGTQACPLRAGTIRGTIAGTDVLGPGAQGIGIGELNELLRAVRAGVTYVNLHTTGFPGGEVRGQIRFDD